MTGSTDKEGFGQRLKSLMVQQRLSLTKIANALGKSPAAVHKWTRGGEIDSDNLMALAALLHVNWIWLRYGEEALADFPAGSPFDRVRREQIGEIMQSEERMCLALRLSQTITWECNLLTNEIIHSNNSPEVLGRTIQTVAEFESLVHPDDLHSVQLAIEQSVTRQVPYEADFRIVWPNGEIRWITARGNLVQDAAGRMTRMVGASKDITERKQAEAALQASRPRLELALEAANMATWQLHFATGELWLSRNAATVFNSPDPLPETLSTFIDMVHPDDRARVTEFVQAAAATGNVQQIEYRVITSDHNIRWFISRGAPFNSHSVHDRYMVGVTAEITARKQSELSARTSQHRLALAMAAGGLGEWTYDPKTGRLECSQRAAELLGHSQATALRTLADLFCFAAQDQRATFANEFESQLHHIGHYQKDFQIPLPDGRTRLLRLAASLERDDPVQPGQYFGFLAPTPGF